jgi:predicted nucleic acid-binding Zn ribbon protein
VTEPDPRFRPWRPRPGRRWSRPRVPGEPRDAVPVGDALAAVGDELGLGDPATLRIVTQRWTEIVGDAVAGHAELRSLRAGVLIIAVDAAPWATQLRYLVGDIQERVAALAGPDTVREVRIVVDPGSREIRS